MDDFRGLFIPLPNSKPNTLFQDGRPLLKELYKSKVEYLYKIDVECTNLVSERLLLGEDVSDLKKRASSIWDWITNYYK